MVSQYIFPRKTLVDYMKRKAGEIARFTDLPYFDEEDAQAILSWSYRDAAKVLARMFTQEGKNRFDFGSFACPFCVKHKGCIFCEYGNRHGMCEHYGENDYGRILRDMDHRSYEMEMKHVLICPIRSRFHRRH